MTSKPSSGALNQAEASRPRMQPRRKALLIVNPNSRRGGEANLQAVVELLEDNGYELIYRESRNAAQCAEELEEYCDDVDLVMVAGGDGTVASVAASLYRHKKPLAILPLGTANDLARSLAIPDDLLTAGRLVLEDRIRWIDLGVVNGHYFFNAVNIGLGTKVAHQLTRDIKKAWGVLSYLKAAWGTLSQQNAFSVTIKVDDRVYRQRSIHLTIGNGRYYGGGNIVDPEAEIDSGKLFLYSITPQPLWRLIFLALLLRLGRQRLTKRTFTASGRHIEIITRKELEVYADGELVARTPAKLEVLPQALAVYAPPRHGSPLEILTGSLDS